MKKIMMILIVLGLLRVAYSEVWVKNDWFVDELSQPAKCIKEVRDTGIIKTSTITKYNAQGFRESAVITLQYSDEIHKKIFVYFQPYQENQRKILVSFDELNQQELLRNINMLDTTIEQWTSYLSYEVMDKTSTSHKFLDDQGHVKELSRSFSSDSIDQKYLAKFVYFDSLADYQLAALDEDTTAIITLKHDGKGSWLCRKYLNSKEESVVKRSITYYDSVN